MSKQYGKYCIEEFARLTLPDILPEYSENWVHSDKPDLQNITDGIGIEVTDSTPENRREIESYGTKRFGKQVSQEEIDKFKGQFYFLGDKVFAFSSSKGSITPRHIEEIEIAIKRKKEKITKYKRFSKNGLFVISSVMTSTDQERLKTIQYSPFDFIIVCCFDAFYYCADGEVKNIVIPQDKIYQYSSQAREYEEAKLKERGK